MEYNADKLDIASLDSACAALLSVNNLQTLSSSMGASLGQIDFSHVPNVTGARVGTCKGCLNSVCGTQGVTPATQQTYNNLYNSVNLLYKSEAEAQGLFGGQTSDANLDFSKYFLDNFANGDYQFGNDFFGETGGSDLTGEALRSACSDALKKAIGERTNLDKYYIIKYFEALEGRYLEAKAKYDEGAMYAMDTTTLDTLAYSTGYGDLAKEYASLTASMKESGLMNKTGWDEIKDAVKALGNSGQNVIDSFKNGNSEEILTSIREFSTQAIATGTVTTEKVVAGVAKVGEGLQDGVYIIGTTLATPSAYVTDALLGTDSMKQMWKDTMDFVSLDRVGLTEQQLYENTKIGQWVNDNSLLKYDSTGAESIKNFTTNAIEDAGVIGLTIATGGTFAPVALAAFKGIETLGSSGEKRFSQTNEAGEFTNRGVKDVALAYLDAGVEFAEAYGQALATNAAVGGIKTFAQAGGMEEIKGLLNKDLFSSAGAYLKSNFKGIAKQALATSVREADTWLDAGTQFAPVVKDSMETGKVDTVELAKAAGNAGLTFVLNTVGNFGGEFASEIMKDTDDTFIEAGRVGIRGNKAVTNGSVEDIEYVLLQQMTESKCSFEEAIGKLELAILDKNYGNISNYGGSRDFIKQYNFDELGAILDNIKQAQGASGVYMHTSNNFFDYLQASGDKFGADQGALYKVYGYKYNGKVYSYKGATKLVDDAIEQRRAIPKFTEVETPEYTTLKNKIKAEYGVTTGEAAVMISSVDDAGACSYAAFCNELYGSFKNDEEAFEKVFGFPMYVQGKNGYVLNSRELLADVYMKVNSGDTKDKLLILQRDGSYTLNKKTLSKKLDPMGRRMPNVEDHQVYMSSTNGSNVTAINRYLSDKGLTYTSNSFDHFSKPFDMSDKAVVQLANKVTEMRGNGYEFTLGIYSNGTEIRMAPYNPKVHPETTLNFEKNSGHAMYVAGVTKTGFVVSSWGNKYLVPFEDLQKRGSKWVLSSGAIK